MEPGVEKRDVFISYRREDGATVARLLYDVLDKRGISAFFDRESIGSGDFGDIIEKNLIAAGNVVVVVSREMFSRCLRVDGTYDPDEVERDWVYREIRIALEQGKNIIPVFVNGVDGFPSLPDAISAISGKNALRFGHEHFDAELQNLIGLLKTPKHQLLEAFWEVRGRSYESMDQDVNDQLDVMIRVCRKFSDAPGAAEKLLKKLIRSRWDLVENEYALDVLIGVGDVDDLRSVCKGLGLDDTGGVSRMRANLLAWLKDGNARLYDEEESGKNRVGKLVSAIADANRSVEERQAIVDRAEAVWGIDFRRGKRSVDDVLERIFDECDVEEFFEEFASHSCLSEDKVKWLCNSLLGQSRGRKRELLDRLLAYVNYEIEAVG